MERDNTTHSPMKSIKRELLNAAEEGRTVEMMQLINGDVNVNVESVASSS